jgi:hypothetical protein
MADDDAMVDPDEQARSIKAEAHRLANLAPGEWRLWIDRRAAQLNVSRQDLEHLVKEELEAREKQKREAETEEKRRLEQRAAKHDSLNDDNDELIRRAGEKITGWKAAGTPSLTEVQELFHESICAGASSMARDRIIDAIIAAFGNELGGKRAIAGTWGKLAKDFATECAEEARASITEPELTPEEKAALRENLWPTVCGLAEAPDLIDQVIKQVHDLGVVNEDELITLTYVGATSRVLQNPVNILTKGVSSGGKSFTALNTLKLIGPDFVNELTSSSALSLVYDTRPLAHTVMLIFEANQLQAEKHGDKDSTFAMLLRTLISEGRIVHQTTVEDPNSPTGRRVERIVREGPIALITTTTGELYSENETRMLSWHIHEDRDQTAAVMAGLADRAAGSVAASPDLAVWHDLQRWIALGPDDAVIPFARQIAAGIEPLMVRFRRDVGSLFSFIKASALLHQAQRQMDAQGRVVANVADYALAYPIFSKVMAESSGKAIPENVRLVVKLITERASATTAKSTGMRFQRVEVAGHASEVTISREQIGTATGIGKWAANRAVNTAIDLGFLVNNETRERKPFRLVLKHGVDEIGVALLPDPKTITREGGAA